MRLHWLFKSLAWAKKKKRMIMTLTEENET